MSADRPQEAASRRPMLRVVRGQPTDAELAALVTVLAARLAAARASAARGSSRPSAWSSPAARLRRPLRPGPGAWRRSGLPS